MTPPAGSCPFRHTVAVVGGGSVATSFVAQLAQQLVHEVTDGASPLSLNRLVILETRPRPGAGAAYEDDTASNLLNTTATAMSPLASDPLHFLRWLQAHRPRWEPRFPGLDVHPQAFLPRALFGLYLEAVFEDSVGALRAAGVQVELVPQEAVELRQVATRGYEILTAQGRRILARSVVLAIGNLESTNWSALQDYPAYFNTPYPCTTLIAQIGADRTVGILGSSLSAIDAAVALADAGHAGKIVMVSRHGRLPSVRGELNSHRQPQLLTRARMQALQDQNGERSATLDDMARMLLQEIELCEGARPCLDAILRPGDGPHRYIDCEVAASSTEDRAWQSIVYALNDAIDLIWHLLRDDQRRIFHDRFRSLWHAYRVSFPLQNARKVQRLLHTNQLIVYGGLQSVRYDETQDRFALDICNRPDGFAATVFTDCLVNATGYTNDVTQCRSPLLRAALSSGLIRPDEFGGIALDFASGQVLSADGVQRPGLFALGSLASGTYFWTNAMNVNARLAQAVARRLIEDSGIVPLQAAAASVVAQQGCQVA